MVVAQTKTYSVYGIVDPRSFTFVYVGKTSDLVNCKRSHISAAASGKVAAEAVITTWIRNAMDAGVQPCFVVLEVVQSWQAALQAEYAWICLLRMSHRLLLDELVKLEAVDREEPEQSFPSFAVTQRTATETAKHSASDIGSPGKGEQARVNQGKPWTKSLDAELASHYKRGVGTAWIAAKQGRSQGSIRSRLVKIGLITERSEARN